MDGLHHVRISIHAPRVGSDRLRPVRGHPASCDFNPRSPGGERRASSTTKRPTFLFQSTLPGWGATVPAQVLADVVLISIHAPRVGSDPIANRGMAQASQFQSTLPGWGATDAPMRAASCLPYFNPRSPGGERPRQVDHATVAHDISIHAPRVGSDNQGYAPAPVDP